MTGPTGNNQEKIAPERAGVLSARPGGRPDRSSPVAGLRRLGLDAARDGLVCLPQRIGTETTAPLVLALHGAGGEASQIVDLLLGATERAGAVLLAPDSRAQTWDMIRGGYGPDVAYIDRALRSVFDLAAIDPRRVAIAGFSDGASYALSLGLANGDLFSDILAFSPGFMAPPRQIGRPKIFISHGTDDQVLPIDRCSRHLAPALRAGGYDLDYREFAGGHIVPVEMISAAFDRFLA